MPFTGFPLDAFAFLQGLAENNSKAWFDANRAAYDDSLVAPAKDFIAEIGPQLRAIAPEVNFEPRVNGSIFRINRDIRFSKDKRPYKTNFDMWFWQGEKRGWESPGFFIRLTPSSFIAGAGMHGFAPPQLAKFRAAVQAEKSGTALAALETAVAPLPLGPLARKTVPRGLDPNHPRARFLLMQGLTAMHDGPLPPSVHTPAFIGDCLAIFRKSAPVCRWLGQYVA